MPVVPVACRMPGQQQRAEGPGRIPDHTARQQPEIGVQPGAFQNKRKALVRLALHEETAQPQPWAAGKERGGPAGMTGRGAQAGHGGSGNRLPIWHVPAIRKNHMGSHLRGQRVIRAGPV
ncbi:MAG: hypothetical protein CMF06_01085 [Hyphomonas sp.]|nr:hypothetical protein [Hyphomonas sp.]MAU65548.1 hypothetical protein [Hyphomonas sp.]MBM59335.1 hypothetical protein [Hyphomonas sp.]